MIGDVKVRYARQNARKKYVAQERRVSLRERRMGVRNNRQVWRRRGDLTRTKDRERPLTELEKKELLLQIGQEKHPDNLKAQIELAQKNGLEVAQKDIERLKKIEKAREDMKMRIQNMKNREVSATEKDAVQQMKGGHADQAMKMLKESGRDGALFNDIAENSAHLAKDMEVLSKETGKHANSVMQKMLAENSVPADTIYKRKDSDRKDQNLEGIKNKKSTQEEVTIAYMQKKKGAAYGG